MNDNDDLTRLLDDVDRLSGRLRANLSHGVPASGRKSAIGRAGTELGGDQKAAMTGSLLLAWGFLQKASRPLFAGSRAGSRATSSVAEDGEDRVELTDDEFADFQQMRVDVGPITTESDAYGRTFMPTLFVTTGARRWWLSCAKSAITFANETDRS